MWQINAEHRTTRALCQRLSLQDKEAQIVKLNRKAYACWHGNDAGPICNDDVEAHPKLRLGKASASTAVDDQPAEVDELGGKGRLSARARP